MGRPKSVAGGRPHVVAVRLSAVEKAHVDQARGSMTAGEYLRYLLLKARKGDTKLS